MSNDMYDDDSVDVVQRNEIGDSGPSLHAPDAHRFAVTHQHDADYGLPDTRVTVAVGASGTTLSCSHGGVSYVSGETAVVPSATAAHWVRSGWVSTESEPEPEPDESAPVGPPSVESKASTKPPTKAPARATAAGSGRRKN